MSGVDEPRFLARGGGYTHSTQLAMDKLEAVSAEEQAQLTAEAHRLRRQQAAREWSRARAQILNATAIFRSAGVSDRQVTDSLRMIERAVARIDQRIAI